VRRALPPAPIAVEAPRVRKLAWWGLTLGVLLTVALVAWQGIGEVTAALAGVGSGIVTILLLHLVQLVADGAGWRAVLAGEQRPGLRLFVWGRWLAESVNDLLPVMQVGGNVVRARALAGLGVPGATAGASVVVDMTLIMATQIPLTLAGICLLVVYWGGGAVVGRAVVGAAVSMAMLGGLIVAQRGGLFSVGARLIGRLMPASDPLAMASGSARLEGEIRRLYGKRRALAACAVWHLAGWLVGTTETWIALYYLGQPVSIAAAIIWQSLSEVIRTAAFGVPGALGVQEGGYIVVGALLGVPPDAALALSLVGRARELMFGIPGILVWRARSAAASGVRRRAAVAEVE